MPMGDRHACPVRSERQQELASQPDAALSLRFQKAKALGLWIQAYRDHIITAHCHVAMIFPAQSLDRCEVAAAVCIDPFRGVDFTQIAGPNPLSGWKLALDQHRCSRLTEAGESVRNLFFSCIVTRHNCCRCLDTGSPLVGFSSQKTKTMIADGCTCRHAPIIELNHLRPLFVVHNAA